MSPNDITIYIYIYRFNNFVNSQFLGPTTSICHGLCGTQRQKSFRTHAHANTCMWEIRVNVLSKEGVGNRP